MATAWLLIVVYGHSAYILPALPSREACEAAYHSLNEKGWAPWRPGGNYDCVQYQIKN